MTYKNVIFIMYYVMIKCLKHIIMLYYQLKMMNIIYLISAIKSI